MISAQPDLAEHSQRLVAQLVASAIQGAVDDAVMAVDNLHEPNAQLRVPNAQPRVRNAYMLDDIVRGPPALARLLAEPASREIQSDS